MQNHAMQTMQSCANANRLDFDGIAEDILKDQPGEFTHFYTAPFLIEFFQTFRHAVLFYKIAT